MNELEERKFRLHAQTDKYRERVERAVGWIHDVFDRYERPCLNYSGGKDSLVLLHLTADRCGYDVVPVYHFDNGLLSVPGDTEFVEDSTETIGGDLHVRTSEAANSEEIVVEEGHGYAGFWGQYFQLAHERGWDVRLLGIRGEESRNRRDRFDSDGPAPPINEHENHPAAAPIHHFTTRDVWAYIVEHGLEYHSVYDEQGELYGDMEARGNRLVTLYDSEFDSLGAREISQFLFPGATNALKQIEQRDRE